MDRPEKQKILVVDDEKLNLNILSDVLKAGYKVILAKNGRQALARAKADPPPDLILLDVMMPDMDGYDVLRQLKADPACQSIPIIFITALNAAEEEEKGLLNGAVDYITKPFNATVVKARVETHLTIVRQRRLLERLANLDGLTEIPNRRSFETALESEWGRCQRNQDPLSLAILDVDHFKNYNDNYGHDAGDKVLKDVAKLISYNVRRGGELAARFGGEEFALLLPGSTAEQGLPVAQAILDELASVCIPHEHSAVCGWLTVSIGGATIIPAPDLESGELIRQADEMLYRAKDSGRNQVVWAD